MQEGRKPGSISVVIPAKNEQETIATLVTHVAQTLAGAEIIVVDDGSTDRTGPLAAQAGARVIRHPVSRGNGAAIKSGVRAARNDILVFMDADGQHRAADVPRLLSRLEEGYDMAVATRLRSMHAGVLRFLANALYNTLASWITGTRIGDLTSGFRAARADVFRQFLALLPNGFSYPTTITMAFLRAGYQVAFEPAQVDPRSHESKSHIRPLRDGGRFFLIIFRVATLYSPLKIFAPLSALFFIFGCSYLTYTMLTTARFTFFSALLFITSVLVFLIGLVSEQITQLLYTKQNQGT